MPRPMSLAIALLLGGAAAVSACGGDGKKDAAGTPDTQSGSAVPTEAGSPEATSSAGTYDATQAQALLDAASLVANDIGPDWVLTEDKSIDNAVAAVGDPLGAASFERCGRLAGRLVANSPSDVVAAYTGGGLVSVFSQLTVFATAAGAADCSMEEARHFSDPGTLARRFGSAFADPDAVVVNVLTGAAAHPQVGDSSFTAVLSGETEAAGTRVGLQIVIVGFLQGNTSAVIGVAHAPRTEISIAELTPYINLTLQRIVANQ